LNKTWRREVRSSREYLKVFASSNEWPTWLERRERLLYPLKGI
jgi:hypothetical protein